MQLDLPEKRRFLEMNWGLVIMALLLFGVGLVNLYSSSSIRTANGITVGPYFQKQVIWGCVGVIFMILSTLISYRTIERYTLFFYVLVVVLLCVVSFWGKSVYGARRWLDFGVMSLQPGELAKFSVLLFGASELGKECIALGWHGLLKIMAIGLIPAILIFEQPDLGTALTVLVVAVGMTLFHGIRWKVFRVCLCVIPLIVPLCWLGLRDYQRKRILTLLDPGSDPFGSGYHIIQSQIAIGSGQLFGKGFQAGTQSQLRFLPEKHTDFAIAVLGEEWGFVGCMLLLILFCLFLLSIYFTAKKSQDRFGSILCSGVFCYFFWQIFVNMGMVVGLMPVVGIPLPFISYGGSSLLVNCILVGLVLNVSMQRYLFRK